jgi:hypothetical protein
MWWYNCYPCQFIYWRTAIDCRCRCREEDTLKQNMYSHTTVTSRLKPYNITTCPSLKWLNGYHHHMNHTLYITTTLLAIFYFFYELYTNTLCFACQLNQDALYNSFMHDHKGMKEVLHQALQKNWMDIHNTTPRSSTRRLASWHYHITIYGFGANIWRDIHRTLHGQW